MRGVNYFGDSIFEAINEERQTSVFSILIIGSAVITTKKLLSFAGRRVFHKLTFSLFCHLWMQFFKKLFVLLASRMGV